MLRKIIINIDKVPATKARAIAKELGVESKIVNALLYENPNLFSCDANFQWSLVPSAVIKVSLPGNCWVDSSLFEKALKHHNCAIDSDASVVIFVIRKGCKILLETAARLMAMCNQLAMLGKTAIIDFSDCLTTFRYLNRMGFFDHLASDVEVLPSRPSVSGAVKFKGNNDKVVEFGAIDPLHPDESIPVLLRNSFVAHTNKSYFLPAFTVLAELFGNVAEHSKSPINGFVALQCYKKANPPHIQTVISDSGVGIVGTLLPVLKTLYPSLAKKIASFGPIGGPMLIQEILKEGGISRSDQDGRGLGLKASGDVAAKFNATVSIRQENFEARIQYQKGTAEKFTYVLDMPKLLGTHICFDFFLDVI